MLLTPRRPKQQVTKATRSRFLKTNPERRYWPVIVSEQSQGHASRLGGRQYNDEAVAVNAATKSKDKQMTAVAVNRGGGRPSKGLRKFIGFRSPEPTADGIAKVAAHKGLTVTEYLLSVVEPQLKEDLAALDQDDYQQELPIRIAS
ncbi:hypothetical protein [Arthrobacter sp. NicSoilB11]|nr:hypothetical protein [Arthrobacter sp. NicSoilB11]